MLISVLSFSCIDVFASKELRLTSVVLLLMIAKDQTDITKDAEQARMQSQHNNISNQINTEYS